MNALLALALGYLLGSVPWGLLLTRAAGLGDIRQVGSGNIGATNVLRTGNKPVAAATLALDIAKGAAALCCSPPASGASRRGWSAGFGAMLGHAFPVWLGFKGGKGVATGGGVILAAAWLAGPRRGGGVAGGGGGDADFLGCGPGGLRGGTGAGAAGRAGRSGAVQRRHRGAGGRCGTRRISSGCWRGRNRASAGKA